ncbi:hypothetical protein VTK56DRAFT_5130 [Thermocarpiscus australiensis]
MVYEQMEHPFLYLWTATTIARPFNRVVLPFHAGDSLANPRVYAEPEEAPWIPEVAAHPSTADRHHNHHPYPHSSSNTTTSTSYHSILGTSAHRYTETSPNPPPLPPSWNTPRPQRFLANVQDIVPSLDLFDAVRPKILKLASRSVTHALPDADRVRALCAILAAGISATTTTTTSLNVRSVQMEALLAWPVLLGAWREFQRDVLSPVEDTSTSSSSSSSSSSSRSMGMFSGRICRAWWRLCRRRRRRRRVLGDDDLGLPNAAIVARRLLDGVQQDLLAADNVARICPVRTEVLRAWTPAVGRWEVTGRPPRACTVEDYYGRFVLRCLAGLYPPSGEGGREGVDAEGVRISREGVRWLRDPLEIGNVKGQMWVLYHVLLFLHCEVREKIDRGLMDGRVRRRLFRWRNT